MFGASALESGYNQIYHYDAYVTSDKCFPSAPLHIFQNYMQQKTCSSHTDVASLINSPDKDSWNSLRAGLHVMTAILPTLIGITLSQQLCQHLPLRSTRRFLMEFLLIATPTICSNTVTSDYNKYFCVLAAIFIAFLLWHSGICGRASAAATSHCYKVGQRPSAITLVRTTAYVCTGCAILAIDFKAFPVDWRKSRRYGASLMDVGIGMFVMAMGVVSHRSRYFGDLKRQFRVVVQLLALGLLRTAIITMIDYHQDEHEYGQHLNAFFCLGFTKLLGSLASLLARSDQQLLPLSMAILALHELLLQLGLSDFVMSDADRVGFLRANREGLSALPGCVALYLLSIWGGEWYKSKDKLNYSQFIAKLRNMLLVVITAWTLVFVSVFLFGIARVTFNAGYVLWSFSVGATMLILYSFLFEFCLMVPMAEPLEDKADASLAADPKLAKPTRLPAFAETINMNGLTYFMLSNLLTGLVNLTLEPSNRSSAECVTILMLYMLASTGTVYVLFRKGIRIA
ncbi:uncharacterized protein PIG-Wa [Drosophila virilis]|uniref:Phosphatidylinositol-glycan biosynthesis class W protein n=1 Tax=Drosophila virilis TaxID=7244 RepID=B4LUD2_DROVI|nr:uncharacterized protein At4g17910 [Drosophila virilis]EDW64118.2 uncharacterized protein Dvir_GJ17289 [Drosophila virilis]